MITTKKLVLFKIFQELSVIKGTDILLFKLLSHKVSFINRKDNRNC